MKLPAGEHAVIPPAKLVDYLLSLTHPVGRSKARFLRAAGFDETNVSTLEHGLLAIARNGDVIQTQSSPHGTKFAVEGELSAPIGGVMFLRTIWIIETGQAHPRLVTAYPAPGPRRLER
jgi:hypothetical protein